MHTADDNGYSIYTDIGQLGAVIYVIVTGQQCAFDLFKDQPTEAPWPKREDLPPTQNVWLGSTIDKCWRKDVFRDDYDLLHTLNLDILQRSLKNEKEIHRLLGQDKNMLSMETRFLDALLLQRKSNEEQQLNWILRAASAIADVHDKHVFIANIAAQNFLISNDGSLRLYNFSEACILPNLIDMDEGSETCIDFKCDVAQLGSLIYHIVTGKRFEFPPTRRLDYSQSDNQCWIGHNQKVVRKAKEQGL